MSGRTGNSALTLLKRLPFRQDVGLVMLMMAALAMMVLPMPTIIADTLIAVNIGISVLLLMVSMYLRSPAEFTTLPSVILVTTIFRLSISITTSRLVLTQADAGEIIKTFGEFVISGNVVVGLVIFLIISIVQFIVITKGSERVAEVSARFALDAMPGKQMSIDTDVRNGDLKPEEARKRRKALAQESQMHGAMDGAMKFVKGDAIASLVIIAVNLIGGITIGCLQHGMSFGEAGSTYSLLAVGDGLIAQIPALLISLSAGLIVTRVDDEDSANLGSDMLLQMTADPRTMMIASLVMAVMGLIPGFPILVFFALSIAFGLAGFLLSRKAHTKKAEAAVALQDALDESKGAALVVQLGPSLAAMRTDIIAVLRHVRADTAEELGISLPRLEVIDVPDPGVGLRIEMDKVQILMASIAATEHWTEQLPTEIASTAEARPGPGGRNWLVLPEADTVGRAKEAGASVFDAPHMAGVFVRDMLLRMAGQFVGIQETQTIITRTEKNYGDLVRESMRSAPLPRLAEVFRRLVEEQVSLRNIRQLLEAVAEWAPREKNTAALTEYVRVGLRQQICQRSATNDMRLPVLLVEDELAAALAQDLHDTITGPQLRPDNPEKLVEQVRAQMAKATHRPALVTTMDLRRPFWDLLSRYGLTIAVLSHPEIAPGFKVDVVGSVGVERRSSRAAGMRSIQGGGNAGELKAS